MGGWRALGEYPKGGTGEAACSYDVLLIDSETQVVWKVQRGLMGDFAPSLGEQPVLGFLERLNVWKGRGGPRLSEDRWRLQWTRRSGGPDQSTWLSPDPHQGSSPSGLLQSMDRKMVGDVTGAQAYASADKCLKVSALVFSIPMASYFLPLVIWNF
jgi:hypothetical protein